MENKKMDIIGTIIIALFVSIAFVYILVKDKVKIEEAYLEKFGKTCFVIERDNQIGFGCWLKPEDLSD